MYTKRRDEMSRAPIQVRTEVKEQLEILKGNMRCSSLQDVISKLIDNDVAAKEFERQVWQEKMDAAAQQKAECIMLGADRKARVVELRELLGLESDAITIDFLLDVFYMSDKIDRSIFMTWMQRAK